MDTVKPLTISGVDQQTGWFNLDLSPRRQMQRNTSLLNSFLNYKPKTIKVSAAENYMATMEYEEVVDRSATRCNRFSVSLNALRYLLRDHVKVCALAVPGANRAARNAHSREAQSSSSRAVNASRVGMHIASSLNAER